MLTNIWNYDKVNKLSTNSKSVEKKIWKNLKKFLTRTKWYGNILNVLDENKEVNNAGVAELADARDLKSRG